eukprot:scaffold642_cov166-Ochromonas_danica.AAC.21
MDLSPGSSRDKERARLGQLHHPKPAAIDNEETSIPLIDAYRRIQNLVNTFEVDCEERRRNIDLEIANLDSRKDREAIDRRRSVQLNLASAASASSHSAFSLEAIAVNESEDLVNSLLAILSDEFDVSDIDFTALDEDELRQGFDLFQTLLSRARLKDSSRRGKLVHALEEFKEQQVKMIEKSTHAYRQATGYFKLQGRVAELEGQLAKARTLLAEKRYVLKAQSIDQISTDDLRLKFEREIEEEIARLSRVLSQQKGEHDRLVGKTEEVNQDTETLCKEIAQILHDLEKEEKNKTKEVLLNNSAEREGQQLDGEETGDGAAGEEEESEDIFSVFPFLEGAVELTEDMVFEAERLSVVSTENLSQSRERHAQVKQRLDEKRSAFQSLLQSDESKLVRRLKKAAKRLEEKKLEDLSRLELLDKLVKNADVITASMAKAKTMTGYGVLTDRRASAGNSLRRSLGGRPSIAGGLKGDAKLAKALEESMAKVAEEEEGSDDEDGDGRADRNKLSELLAAKNLDDNGKYQLLQQRYQRVAERIFSERLKNRKKPSEPERDKQKKEKEEEKKKEEEQALPPSTLQRGIFTEQIDSIQLAKDQFEAVASIYKNSFGLTAAIVPFTEMPIQQPFHYSPRRSSIQPQSRRTSSVGNAGGAPTSSSSPSATSPGSRKNSVLSGALPTKQMNESNIRYDKKDSSSEGLVPAKPNTPLLAEGKAVLDFEQQPQERENTQEKKKRESSSEEKAVEEGEGEGDGLAVRSKRLPRVRDMIQQVEQRHRGGAASPSSASSRTRPAHGSPSFAMSQAERTQWLEAQMEADQFQTFGLKRAVQQLLGFISVLTHWPGAMSEDELYSMEDKITSLASGGVAESVSVAMLEPLQAVALSLSPPTTGTATLTSPSESLRNREMLKTEAEELENVEKLQMEITQLIGQVKEIYKQSHHIHNQHKTLLRDYQNNVQKFDKIKAALFREVERCRGMEKAEAGEQHLVLQTYKQQLNDLRQQLQLWQMKVAQRKASANKLAEYFKERVEQPTPKADHEIAQRKAAAQVKKSHHPQQQQQQQQLQLSTPSAAAHDDLSRRYTNSRYQSFALPQAEGIDTVEEVHALYEETLKNLQTLLQNPPPDSTATTTTTASRQGGSLTGLKLD